MSKLANILESDTVTLVRVLEQIRREGPISQVEIGQKLGIGRAAVNIHTKKLLADKVIVPTGDRQNTSGRPRMLLDLAREGKGVIGISLDAPQLSGAVMDFSNQIVVKREWDVSDISSHEELSERIGELVKEMMSEAEALSLDIYSACFSVPGVLEMGTGKILNHVNMPAANGLDAKQLLGDLLGVPIYIVPLGVAVYWGGLEPEQSEQHIFHVNWDLGVGVMFGKGYEIQFKEYTCSHEAVNSNIRDIGHTTLWPNGRKCHCGRRGCLEAYLGGHAITDRWNERKNTSISLSTLLDKARERDPEVVNLIARQARRLGETLGWIFAVHQPGFIKLSGQIPDALPVARDAFWEGVQRRMADGVKQTRFDFVGDNRSVQLSGTCRLALHVRFNRPLLDIVSGDDVSDVSENAAAAVVVG